MDSESPAAKKPLEPAAKKAKKAKASPKKKGNSGGLLQGITTNPGTTDEYAGLSLTELKGACRAKGLPLGGTKLVLRARLEMLQ